MLDCGPVIQAKDTRDRAADASVSQRTRSRRIHVQRQAPSLPFSAFPLRLVFPVHARPILYPVRRSIAISMSTTPPWSRRRVEIAVAD